MKLRVLALVAFLLGVTVFEANAQTPSTTGTVRGFIYDK
jgi:hypothetical protein